jgi:hypothetical protein
LVADDDPVRQLADLVGRQAAGLDVWKDAELHVIEVMFRERLAVLGITPCADLAAGLMALAQLLSESAPEFGGDARDTLADVAVLGLRLLEPDG